MNAGVEPLLTGGGGGPNTDFASSVIDVVCVPYVVYAIRVLLPAPLNMETLVPTRKPPSHVIW